MNRFECDARARSSGFTWPLYAVRAGDVLREIAPSLALGLAQNSLTPLDGADEPGRHLRHKQTQIVTSPSNTRSSRSALGIGNAEGVVILLAVSPDQEERLCDALVNLGWLENDHALHAEAVIAIGNILGCSTDDAKAILGDLRTRNLIDVTSTREGDLDPHQRLTPAKLRWIRLRTHP